MPGFGLSGENDENDFSDTHDLAVIMGLLDHLAIRKASFIGNSLGGKLAWRVASAYADRVEKLVLLSPDGFASEGFEYDKQPEPSFMLSAMTTTLPKPLLKIILPALVPAACPVIPVTVWAVIKRVTAFLACSIQPHSPRRVFRAVAYFASTGAQLRRRDGLRHSRPT